MKRSAETLVVNVKPGAKAPGIVVGLDGAIVVRVRERAMEGKANEAVCAALARTLGLPKSAVTLVRGAKARIKTFAIAGLPANEVKERLAQTPKP